MDRRHFLDLARYAALCATVPNEWRVTRRPRLIDNPFQLGVASGDPTATAITLWTRIAPKPLEPDGGMNEQRTVVSWELADDEAFSKIVKRGRVTSAPELGYSVHADVDGLTPDRWYFYRFMVGDAVSAVGRTRTSPADGATTPLRLAVVGCQHYEQGLYTAYEHLAKEEMDIVTHTGDYIYETSAIDGRVRRHPTNEAITLEHYRQRYALYRTDQHLQAAHARFPWILTWDDHEVDNNYAGLVGENDMESEEQMRTRRGAAYQAYWENQPVRVPRAKSWSDLSVIRSLNWGSLARFWVLDTRQFRSDQACGDGNKVVPCGNWADPSRTLMGDAQEKWLVNGLTQSKSRWQAVVNQVMMAPFDDTPGAEVRVSMDQWSGYPVARDRLLGAIARHAPNRTVVMTGDIHSAWVNELKSSFSRPDAPTIAAEFVGTSISSGGDGFDRAQNVNDKTMPENPHVKWQNSRRGYIACEVNQDEWKANYRTVQYVSKPGAPLVNASSWKVRWGKAGIEKV